MQLFFKKVSDPHYIDADSDPDQEHMKSGPQQQHIQ